MNWILKYSSYLFHPLFIPFIGVGIFYSYSVKYHSELFILNRLIQLCILTIIIPLLIFRVLKKLGFISSIMAEKVSERKIPYFIAIALNLYISFYIFKDQSEIELRYFFLGIAGCSIAFFILSLLHFKASLHMAAIGGLTTFIIGLSLHFKINMVVLIGVFFLLNGLIASSRLHLKAHSVTELIIGSIMGIITQFLMFIYWL